MKNMKPVQSVDAYIQGYSPEIQVVLEKMRQTIKKVEPQFTEAISYGVPTFKINGKYVVYMGAFKKHISIFPAPRSAAEFKKELEQYAGGKGTVQFPYDKPIPYELVTRIVKYLLHQRLGQ